ncbi:MAG: hypothetical protein WC637_00545 [Victivallales bacterium]
MNQNTVTVQLTVKDDGSVVMKQFGKNSEEALGKVSTAAPKATSALNSLKSSYLEFAAKAATAYMVVSKAIDLMDLGAKAIQAEESFKMVARANNENVNQVLADLKRVSAGVIDDSAIMQKTVKGMVLGLSGNELVKIMEASRLAARLTGEDVQIAFEKITDAIATNMPRALRQYGLVTKEQLAIVNKAIAAGIEDVNLYGLAMANAAEQAKKLTVAERNLVEEIQRGKAAWAERKEEAGKWLDILIVLYGKYEEWEKESKNEVPLLVRWFGSPAEIAQVKDLMNQINHVKPMTFAQRFDAQKGDLKIVKTPAEYTADITAETNKREALKKAQAALEKAIEDAKRLREAWKEVQMTLNAKIEGGGMSEFQKDLIANQLEADKLTEKFGKLKGAIDLIQKAQAAEDTDARIKAENKALEAFESRIEQETARDKQIYEKRQKDAEERLSSERDIYQDLRGYEDSYYAATVALIENQAKKYRDQLISEVDITAWATEEKLKAQRLLDRTIGGGDFSKGWSQGLTDYTKSLGNYFTQGEELAKNSATAMHDSFQSIFFDGFKGQLKSFSDYWTSFTDSLLQSFSKMLADMVTKWMMSQMMMEGGSMTGNLVGGAIGLVGSAFSGGAPVAHAGGMIGYDSFPTRMIPFHAFAGAPRLHNGLASDEFPAILQRGEKVLSRKEVAQGNGGNSIMISIPITSDVGSKKMIVDLKNSLESTVQNTVEKVIKRHS